MDSMMGILASQQTMTQNAVALEAMKLAIQGQQQVVDLLSQAVEAGKVANPAHMGQSLDTYA